jgi:hypothetical protein
VQTTLDKGVTMNYIIVKNAALPDYFDYNPQDGIDLDWSADVTYTGQQVGIRPSYAVRQDAEVDCKKMNDYNPHGHYAVCPVMK